MACVTALVVIWQKIPYIRYVGWDVRFTTKAAKQVAKLPEEVRLQIVALVAEIAKAGPYRANWKKYGPLKNQPGHHHCHVKSGRPTYVVCWEVRDKKIRLVEVYYAGTHEGAPY
jgi:mRNA-degrading endonuclease RelE of RelBE toxin-antitoxin system